MAQNNVEFIKKATYQLNKTDFSPNDLDDIDKIKNSQELLNAQINAGDSIVDAEMPSSFINSELDWTEIDPNDLFVKISTQSDRISIIQDLAGKNIEIKYPDEFSFIVEGGEGGGQVTIPTHQNHIADFIIDWGDGTFSDITSWDSPGLSHMYPSFSTFKVTIKGICEYLNFGGVNSSIVELYEMKSADNLKVVGFDGCNINKIHPSWKKWTEVEQFINLFKGSTTLQEENIPKDLFRYATKATTFTGVFRGTRITSIDPDIFKYNTEVTDFSYAFENTRFLLEIPDKIFINNTKVENFSYVFSRTYASELPMILFKYNTEVTDFNHAFYGCASLTNIPYKIIQAGELNNKTLSGNSLNNSSENNDFDEIIVNFFDSNTKVENFRGVFSDCSSLETIPDELFKYNTLATDFSSSFSSCYTLTSIPPNLFNGNSLVENFSGTFSNCFSITTMPNELFKYNTEVTNFNTVFSNCTSLTSIPIDLFRYNTKVTNFISAFYSTDIVSIPADLFRYNTLVEDFNGSFRGCSSLTSIPAGLFSYNTAVTNFSSAFYNCSSLASISAGLFDDNALVEDFSYIFYGCSSLTSIPEGLFDNNTAVTDFSSTFYKCSSLTSIPEGLFDNNTLAEDFSSTFGSTGITSIPVDLFRYNILVTSFFYTFSFCPSLISIPVDLFRYNTLVTSFKEIFRNNTSLIDVPVDLFNYNSIAENFDRIFYGCNSMAGTVTDFNNLIMNIVLNTNLQSRFNAFTGATSLIDYDLIPNVWGGPGLSSLTNNWNFTVHGSAANWTLQLDVNSALNTNMDIYVNWGDGTAVEHYTGVVSNLHHDYTNGAVDNILNIKGTLKYLKFNNVSKLTAIGALNRDLGIETLSFNECYNLTSINISSISNCKVLKDASNLFAGCYNIGGYPTGLLNSCYYLENLSYAFKFATTPDINKENDNTFLDGNPNLLSLEGTFSKGSFNIFGGNSTDLVGLFKNNTKVTTFKKVFEENRFALTLPDDLFRYNTLATDFSYAFVARPGGQPSSITLPPNLFKYNTLATNFSNVFFMSEISGGSVSQSFFSHNTEVTDFSHAFHDTGLTSIPAGFLDYNTKVINLEEMFSNNGITSIPVGLFNNNVLVENFSKTLGATGVTSIPVDLFKYNTEATNFHAIFYGCTHIASIPADLFKYNTKVVDFSNAFEYCYDLASLPVDLFRYNTLVTDFHNIFGTNNSLTSLPADLFKYNTLVTDFSSAFYNSSLASIPADIILYNTLVENYTNMFKGGTSITTAVTGANNFIGQAETNATNEGITLTKSGCFDGCTSISDYASIPTGAGDWRTS